MIFKHFTKQYLEYKLYAKEEFLFEQIKTELSKSFLKSGRNISGKMLSYNKFRASKIFSASIDPDILGMYDVELNGEILASDEDSTKIIIVTKPHVTYLFMFTSFQVISFVLALFSDLMFLERIGAFLFFECASFLSLFLVKRSRSKLINSFESIINPWRTEFRSDIHGN